LVGSRGERFDDLDGSGVTTPQTKTCDKCRGRWEAICQSLGDI
jgi:hypothetical protein